MIMLSQQSTEDEVIIIIVIQCVKIRPGCKTSTTHSSFSDLKLPCMRADLLRGVTKLPSKWSNDPGNKHYTKRKGFPFIAFFISQRVFCLHFKFPSQCGSQGRVIVPYVAPFATSPALTRTRRVLFSSYYLEGDDEWARCSLRSSTDPVSNRTTGAERFSADIGRPSLHLGIALASCRHLSAATSDRVFQFTWWTTIYTERAQATAN